MAFKTQHPLNLAPPSAISNVHPPPTPSRSRRQLPPREALLAHRPVLWVHRHIHKTGGTSLRAIFKQLHERKALTLVPGWNCRIDRIKNLSASTYSASADAVSHGWCAEMHQDCKWFSAQLLPLIHRLRGTMRVLLSAFVREPFAHSLSLWMWAGKPKYGKYNHSIDYWLPFNFQSNTLLYGDHFDQFFKGNKPPKGALYRSFSERNFESLVSVMRARYDVVCPTGRMELCITYMLRDLGLPMVATPRIAPRHDLQTGIALDHALLLGFSPQRTPLRTHKPMKFYHRAKFHYLILKISANPHQRLALKN